MLGPQQQQHSPASTMNDQFANNVDNTSSQSVTTETAENNLDLDSIPDHQLLISLSMPKPASRKPFGVAVVSSGAGSTVPPQPNTSCCAVINPIDAIPLPNPLPIITSMRSIPSPTLPPSTTPTPEDCEAASSIASLSSAAEMISSMPAMTAAGSDSMGMCSSSGNGAAFPTPAASASNLVIYANFIFPKSTCASSGAGTGRGRKQQRPPISIPVTTASVILGGSDERNFKLGKSFPIPCWYPWLFGPESALVPIGKLDDDLCRYHALIGFNWQLKIFQIAALDNDYSISVDGVSYKSSDGAVALRSNSKITIADIQITFDLSMMTSTLSSNLSHSIFRFIQSLQSQPPPPPPLLAAGAMANINVNVTQSHPVYPTARSQLPLAFYDDCLVRILQVNGPMTLRMLLAKLESEHPQVTSLGQKLPLIIRSRLTSGPRFLRCNPPEYLPYQGKDSFWTLASTIDANGGGEMPLITGGSPSPRYSPDPKKAKLSTAGSADSAAASLPKSTTVSAMNEQSVSAFKQFISEAQSSVTSSASSVLTAPSSRAHSPHFTPPSYLRNPIYHRPISGGVSGSSGVAPTGPLLMRSRSMIVEPSTRDSLKIASSDGLLESRKVMSEASLPSHRALQPLAGSSGASKTSHLK